MWDQNGVFCLLCGALMLLIVKCYFLFSNMRHPVDSSWCIFVWHPVLHLVSLSDLALRRSFFFLCDAGTPLCIGGCITVISIGKFKLTHCYLVMAWIIRNHMVGLIMPINWCINQYEFRRGSRLRSHLSAESEETSFRSREGGLFANPSKWVITDHPALILQRIPFVGDFFIAHLCPFLPYKVNDSDKSARKWTGRFLAADLWFLRRLENSVIYSEVSCFETERISLLLIKENMFVVNPYDPQPCGSQKWSFWPPKRHLF